MAKCETVVEDPTYVLTLNSQEAGNLMTLLTHHDLDDDFSTESIQDALNDAGVKWFPATSTMSGPCITLARN